MNFFCVLMIFLVVFPVLTHTIRCYKCDATNECKTINTGLSARNYDYSSDNVEVIECEENCWKSISLGK